MRKICNNRTDDNTGISHVFELRIGMTEFDHRSFLSLLKQQQESLEKFRPERGFETWPLRCRCSAPPVELSGRLGGGRYVGRL